ncbi:hypothetical protein Pmani_025185 [Petrolisthes manimaculis]|uniref:Uncharacterized protein n=1 Tax=Petrolisthes manimaculis TaxID=1843537 RepID=A0AAE1P891_9EUCA|nr:hypothetical protein Pmani_025185 [Petrolisthes manimaculis]
MEEACGGGLSVYNIGGEGCVVERDGVLMVLSRGDGGTCVAEWMETTVIGKEKDEVEEREEEEEEEEEEKDEVEEREEEEEEE